jgi:hypothetical protein
LCDSYDALPNCSNSKQTTPTTLHNSNFGSLNDNSIYKCSSDCCSVERKQCHNHHTHSHLNNSNAKRKQKTKHHHRSGGNNRKHSPQETISPYSHQVIATDQSNGQNLAANYEYIIGDESHCDEDEGSCNLGKVTISENEETTEHDDDEIGGNSYSCDDTLTDDAILSGHDHREQMSKSDREFKAKHSDGEHSGSGGETCCSCSDTSCVYEEPPSHPPIQVNKGQALRVGNEI